MHPDNEPIALGTGNLYIIGIDMGEETPLGPVTDISETIVPDPVSPDAVYRINKAPEATFTFTLYEKKMSRKRFVKLLMARGYCRNLANHIARMVVSDRSRYSMNYSMITLYGLLPITPTLKKEKFERRYMGKWHYEEDNHG